MDIYRSLQKMKTSKQYILVVMDHYLKNEGNSG